MEWYLKVFKEYATFSGRARRKEYWMFFLFNLIVSVVLSILDNAIGTYPLLSGLYSLAVLVPSLAVGARRLHDTGRSGWWQLIALIPFVGGIILLVFLAQDSKPGTNEYGLAPKAV